MAGRAMPSDQEVVALSLAEFAYGSYVWAGLSESSIAALGKMLGFEEEEMRILHPGVIASLTNEEYEEALVDWEIDGVKMKAAAKARARWARTVMQRLCARDEAGEEARGRAGGDEPAAGERGS